MKRIIATIITLTMILSTSITVFATNLSEYDVNEVLSSHGFGEEAINNLNFADKKIIALQIMAGTHTFEESTSVEYFNIDEKGRLEIVPYGAISSSDVKMTITGSKVTEYGEFAYILYYITCEWLREPTVTRYDDAISVSWSDSFNFNNSSYQTTGYYKTSSSGSWILDYTDTTLSQMSASSFGDYVEHSGFIPKWQTQFKLYPSSATPSSGLCVLNVTYAHYTSANAYDIMSSSYTKTY